MSDASLRRSDDGSLVFTDQSGLEFTVPPDPHAIRNAWYDEATGTFHWNQYLGTEIFKLPSHDDSRLGRAVRAAAQCGFDVIEGDSFSYQGAGDWMFERGFPQIANVLFLEAEFINSGV